MTINRATRNQVPPTDPAADGRGWGERIQRLVLEMRALARDHVELAVLETQRAGQVLVQAVAAAVAVSVLLATAWLGLVAALVVWLTDAGVSWPAALLIGAASCVALAGGILFWVKKQIPELMFSATLRQLRATKAVPDHVDIDLDLGKDPDYRPMAGAAAHRVRPANEGLTP